MINKPGSPGMMCPQLPKLKKLTEDSLMKMSSSELNGCIGLLQHQYVSIGYYIDLINMQKKKFTRIQLHKPASQNRLRT